LIMFLQIPPTSHARRTIDAIRIEITDISNKNKQKMKKSRYLQVLSISDQREFIDFVVRSAEGDSSVLK
jgi:hypothetical protein